MVKTVGIGPQGPIFHAPPWKDGMQQYYTHYKELERQLKEEMNKHIGVTATQISQGGYEPPPLHHLAAQVLIDTLGIQAMHLRINMDNGKEDNLKTMSEIEDMVKLASDLKRFFL